MDLIKNQSAVKRYKLLMRFANWLQQLPNKVTPPPFRLIQIGAAFWQSRALYVATKLGIADALSDAEINTAALAKALNVHEDHLYRLLRMLASIGIFTETAERVFKNSKLSNYLREDNPHNVRAMILMHNSAEMVKPWYEALEAAIRDGGIAFEKVNGMALFEYMNQNKRFDALFSQAMDNIENITGSAFLDDLNWGNFKRIIDVGGSKGSKSLSILESYPELTALIFDRHQVVQGAREYWQGTYAESVLQRAEFVGGDVFESIPQAESDADVYLFMAVFHSFSDGDCEKILHNLNRAMGDKSPRVVIADMVASEINIDAMTASLDMQMLIGTEGRERTRSEWSGLVQRCGFSIEDIVATRSPVNYLILRKQP